MPASPQRKRQKRSSKGKCIYLDDEASVSSDDEQPSEELSENDDDDNDSQLSSMDEEEINKQQQESLDLYRQLAFEAEWEEEELDILEWAKDNPLMLKQQQKGVKPTCKNLAELVAINDSDGILDKVVQQKQRKRRRITVELSETE
jgi:hypothetical protein